MELHRSSTLSVFHHLSRCYSALSCHGRHCFPKQPRLVIKQPQVSLTGLVLTSVVPTDLQVRSPLDQSSDITSHASHRQTNVPLCRMRDTTCKGVGVPYILQYYLVLPLVYCKCQSGIHRLGLKSEAGCGSSSASLPAETAAIAKTCQSLTPTWAPVCLGLLVPE